MRLSTRVQSQKLDELAQSEYGLSSETLMEAAGTAVVQEIESVHKNKKLRILILIGSGNNGADGFVVARLLKRKGFANLAAIVVREKSAPSKIWNFQLEKAKNSGVEIQRFSIERLKMEVLNADILVESILGTGFKSSLDAELCELVDYLNQKNKYIVAVDTPMGLDVDTGSLRPKALRAKMTVSFGLAKPGFFTGRGPRYVGKLKIHRVGFPMELIRRECLTHFAWGAIASQDSIPGRDELSNKSDHGRVLVVAGSSDYPGAGVLVSHAAGRAGAGYVNLFADSAMYEKLPLIPEVILRDRKSLDLSKVKRDTAFILGPGVGVNETTERLIRDLVQKKFTNVVLDADALTIVAQKKIWPLPSTWILTPHAGELARILDCNVESLNNDRFKAAQKAAALLGCRVLFKGFRTILCEPNANLSCIIVLSGNSALAKAGSGDVLSGFIAAFLAQGLSPTRSSCLGAYLHGKIANQWVRQGKDIISLLPSDLSEALPSLLYQMRHKNN